MSSDPIRRDIIDNTTDGITMKRVLESGIPLARRFDVSTGYFNVEGYGLLRRPLEDAVRNDSFSMRLLLGRGAIPLPEDTFETRAAHHSASAAVGEWKGGDEPPSVKDGLDTAEIGPGSQADTSSLIALLERPNVQVRIGPSRFNHSKCYILGDSSVFIGSSNFTASGLEGNHELNAGLYQPGVAAETRSWFDHMWNDAADAKACLLHVLKESKFGVPPDPYDVYMKMLFEKFKPFLEKGDKARRKDLGLTVFQQDAVDTSMHVMENYGGAIIADSTGLGKTKMGIEIMRQKILDEGKRVMLIAPAQVLHGMWTEKLKEVDISVREMVTMERMGREDFLDDLEKYSKIDLVVIDESQNFRSKTAKRRENLMKMLSVGRPKQALLLTATPINNSLMDLYYQLSIITKGADDHFWDTVGIVDLRRHMRDAAGNNLRDGLDKIQQLLDSVMVRRTRSFIRDVYRDDKINGKPVTFPEHEFKPIRYDLAGLYGDVFDRVFKGIKSLTMAPYGPKRYDMTLPQEEREAHRLLAHLQVVMLLKRFESSTEAIRISIDNKIRMYEHVERVLRRGRLLRVGDFNAALRRWSDREMDGEADGGEDPEEEFARMVEGIAADRAGPGFDRQAMLRDINSDLKTLRNLADVIGRASVDKKFEAVRDTIIGDGALEGGGRKVLLFTEYTATAKYIYRRMSETFGDWNILLIHGGTRTETRQKYIRRFAPRANLPEGEVLGEGEQEADILISTEVLSEGQNLQDCNYVVNYDLPWNPMRIVQRTGRVDRLTSEHKTVRSRACYPDKQLDDLLQLVGKIMDKVDTVAEVVGTDVEILDRMPSPKEYNGRLAMDIRNLAAGEAGRAASVIRRMEAESDMMPPSTPFNEIMRHAKEIGLDAMKAVPMGRRSGQRGDGQKAVLAYLQEGGRARRVHFVVYDYETRKAEVPDNDTDAIRLAACTRDTPPHLPMDGAEHRESFEELLRIDREARAAIEDRDRDGRKKVANLRSRRSESDLVVSKLQDELVTASTNGVLSKESADVAYQLLESNRFRAWTNEMRELLGAYKADGDAERLVQDIRKLADRIHVGDKIPDGYDSGPTDENDFTSLKLVGAMFIMKDFDPDLGRRGMDRHFMR